MEATSNPRPRVQPFHGVGPPLLQMGRPCASLEESDVVAPGSSLLLLPHYPPNQTCSAMPAALQLHEGGREGAS